MTVVSSRATALLPDAVEEVVAAAMVPPALLRSLAVERQALLRLGRTAHVRPLSVLDLTNGGDVRIVRSATRLPTVGEVVRTAGPLPWRDAALVVVQAARALADAHHLGLAHPALSPDRLLVTGPGEVCLDGFGVLAELDRCLGHPGDPLATPLPPGERGRRTTTTDSFALAAIFVALVSAAPADPDDLDGALAAVPEELASVLRSAMAPDPAARPRPGVLAATLAEWAVAAPVTSPAPARLPLAAVGDVTIAPATPATSAAAPSRVAAMPWGKVGLGVVAAILAVTAGRMVSGDGATGIETPSVTTIAAPEAVSPVVATTQAVAPATPAVAETPTIPPVAPTAAPVPTTATPTTATPDTVAPTTAPPTTSAPVATTTPRATRRAPAGTTTTAAPAPRVVEPAAGPPVELVEPAFDGPGPGSVG